MATETMLLILLCLCLAPLPGSSKDSTFTFRLPPGRTECFYEYINQGALLEVEYQVISGGELDINFFIKGPNGNILASDEHKLDSLNSVDVRESGEYEICLDNSFSRMSEKLVFVDIIIEDDVAREEEKKRMGVGADLAESMEVDMKLQNLSHVLTNITIYLNKIVRDQQFFRARESRHRHTLEGSNGRVLWWSLTNCVVVVTVGIMQVMLVRNLFNTKRKDKIRT